MVSKRTFYDGERAVEDGRHVESDVAAAAGVESEVLGRQPAHAQLFAPGDRFGGRTQAIRAPVLYLAEHDDLGSGADEVDLAVTAAPVAVQDLVALCGVPPGNPVLPEAAERKGSIGPVPSHVGERSAVTTTLS